MQLRTPGTLMREMKLNTGARSDRRQPGHILQSPIAVGNPPVLSGWKPVTTTQTIGGLSWHLHNSGRTGTILQDIRLPNLYQFEVIPGDVWASDAAGVERSELKCDTSMSFTTGNTTSYMMRIFDPGPKDAGSDGWVLMGQLHATPDAGDAGVSPMFARELGTSTRNITYNRRTSLVDPIVSNPSSNYFYTDSAPGKHWGRWISVVEEHLIDPSGGTGYHKVYHDGVLVADSGVRNTGYVDAVGPYLKYGIYRDEDLSSTHRVQFYFNGSFMA